MEEYTLESVREIISNLHENFPPQTRTPEIKKLLDELYKIETELISKSSPLKRSIKPCIIKT